MGPAGAVLLVVIASVVTGLAVVGGGALLVLRRLRRANQVRPGTPSPAPLSWLWSFRAAARMHRRLAAVVAAGRAAVALRGASGLGLDQVAGELERRAVDLDAQLVVADRAPAGPRARMLRELRAESRELESLVERVIRMSRAWSGASPSERGLGPIRERLDLLEQALRELDGIDQAAPAGPATGHPAARLAAQTTGGWRDTSTARSSTASAFPASRVSQARE